MIQSEFTVTIIKAEENHYLTQVDDNISLTDRIIADEIALGKYDSPENWKEITKEEGDAIKAEQEKLIEEQHNEAD